MPLVKKPHGGDKGNAVALSSFVIGMMLKRFDGGDDIDGEILSSKAF
jgi:hypothetical protein